MAEIDTYLQGFLAQHKIAVVGVSARRDAGSTTACGGSSRTATGCLPRAA